MTQQTANVICKENGNTTALAYRSVPLDFGPIRFPILGSRFQCSGSESSLCQCGSVSEICSSMEIVEVQCDLPGKFNTVLDNWLQQVTTLLSANLQLIIVQLKLGFFHQFIAESFSKNKPIKLIEIMTVLTICARRC